MADHPDLGTRGPGAAVLAWTLGGRARGLAGWAVAVAVMSLFYTATYSFFDADQLGALADSMPAGLLTALGMDDFVSVAGYVGSTVFGLLGPVLLLVHGIGGAASVLAGEEESGALELELTAPVSRRTVLLQRSAAVLLGLAGLVAVIAVTVALTVTLLGLDGLPVRHVLAAALGLLLLTGALTLVTVAAGAVTGSRTVALAAGAGLAAASYVAESVGAVVDPLSWLRPLSPWHWYAGSSPLRTGLDVPGFLGLLGLALLALVVALAAFDRRDLRGG